MATIDLIVLGMLKQKPLSAYDIQKQVEYRNISRWVKISTPSVYKKVLRLEEEGYIRGAVVKEGNMPEKIVYALTKSGEQAFERLMCEISEEPIRIFLDFNAVMVNLESLPAEKQAQCLRALQQNVRDLKRDLAQNSEIKMPSTEISASAKAVLQQQYILAEAIESWLASVHSSKE